MLKMQSLGESVRGFNIPLNGSVTLVHKLFINSATSSPKVFIQKPLLAFEAVVRGLSSASSLPPAARFPWDPDTNIFSVLVELTLHK